jgi:hypothetical protein
MRRQYSQGWWKGFQSVAAIVMWFFLVQVADAQPNKKTRPVVEKTQSNISPTLTTKQEMNAHTDDLRVLMESLYMKLPEELSKSTQVGAREMTEWVFDGKANWKFEVIRDLQKTEAINLVFDSTYSSDRVLALVVGLETLLFNAYGGKNEFEIPAERHQSQLMQVGCQLQSLQMRLDSNDEQITILQQADARQLIRRTLEKIVGRINAQASNQRLGVNC